MPFRRVDLDRLGTAASLICAVHCVLTSVALTALGVMGLGFFADHRVDLLFVSAAVLVGTFAVAQGYRRHRSFWPATLFVIGLAMVLSSHTLIPHGHGQHRVLSGMISASGGLMLVGFHILNAYLQKRCCDKLFCSHDDRCGSIQHKLR